MTAEDIEEPPIREKMNISIEIYDDFSLAMWDQRPGSCGTGVAPADAITDLLEFIAHEYEELAATPEDQCHKSLNDLRPAVKKFFEGLPKKEDNRDRSDLP